MKTNVERWQEVLISRDLQKLNDILAEEVIFYSPVVHTPQIGKKVTQLYLSAALHVIANNTFSYAKKVIDGNETILEFETEIDGVLVNGVDIITWNDDGKIIAFKVMIRPLKAINLIHQKMGELLSKYN
ncbi:MAG: hypothetical protein COA67_08080 [Lutibacter sp.]|nr:MAG: hypothetical protein COA67_08080 [Lutibacter sp.]